MRVVLDWSKFIEVSGNEASARDNFEKLCRDIVTRNFSYLGSFKERKNQPGVEFYLELNQDEKGLAKKGQTVGWQCKWFDYSSGNLRSASRRKIQESLDKTLEHVSDIDIWILCTHKTLSKKDQTWFYGLQDSYSFDLHLWNENDIEGYLSGATSDLKKTYFGELAFTRKIAEELHRESISPIAKRWNHKLHNEIEQEHKIRKILGEPQGWQEVIDSQGELSDLYKIITKMTEQAEYKDWRPVLIDFLEKCRRFIDFSNAFKEHISTEQIDEISDIINREYSDREAQSLLNRLRKNNLPLALYLTNAIASINDVKSSLKEASELLNHQFIALIAKAGGGKTHFAAEITSSSEIRPAGIFIRGHYLKKNGSLDDLAQRVHLYGEQVPTFKLLLSAVNTFGIREGCRIPIVIDGLNEAEDPRDWSTLLETANTLVNQCSNVVLICTLRPAIESHQIRHTSIENTGIQSIPESALILYSDGFSEHTTIKAVNNYFQHYKIEANLATIPLDFFRNPLTLKTFCDVTNPTMESVVQVKSFPTSIYSLHDKQIENSAVRIAEMSNLSIKYRREKVLDAIYDLGEVLWFSRKRSIPESDFLELNGGSKEDWDANIVNLLAQEGLIFREQISRKIYYLMPTYDKLGGFLIAKYLLDREQCEFEKLVKSSEFETCIFNGGAVRHQLAEDVLHALVVNTPKHFQGKQLWKAISEDLRVEIIPLSYLIDTDDLDEDTINLYRDFLEKNFSASAIKNLLLLKNVISHAFNSYFLSDLLTKMSMVERDIIWTEYHRYYNEDILELLKERTRLWKEDKFDDIELEKLRVTGFFWLLTTTNKVVRNKVTEAIFNFGLKQPQAFLDIAAKLLKVNDMYVVERLLAASYGVVGVLIPKGCTEEYISKFVDVLYDVMFSNCSDSSTTHFFARDYASQIIQVFNKYNPKTLSDKQLQNISPPFSSLQRINWKECDPESIVSYQSNNPFRREFENYSIGRLVPDRRNYDYQHSDYQTVRNQILWRVFDLGWSGEVFSNIDKIIASESDFSRSNINKTERYGDKYSWIAYYEIAGELSDQNKLLKSEEEARFDKDIDPFFPSISVLPFNNSDLYLGGESITVKEWFSQAFDPPLCQDSCHP